MIARSPCDAAVVHATRSKHFATRSVGVWVLAATILGSIMVFVDGTVVNIVLPVLQRDLGASPVELQWIVVGYTLFLGSLMLLGGSLGDHFGRRRVFVIGAAVFASASALCGLAPTPQVLVVARIVQGIGSALLTPGSLALIGANFDDDKRPGAIGVWSSFTAIAGALGPGFGGWLAQTAGWRWVFFINVPLAVAVIAISLSCVPESRDDESVHRLDVRGAVLGTLSLGAIVVALTWASALGFAGSALIFGAGLLLLLLFVWAEARARAPMLPLRLFASPTFTGVNVLTLLLYGALSVVMFFLPFDLVQVQGYSLTSAGFALLPAVTLIFLLSNLAGVLAKRFGMRTLLFVGPLTAAVGCALFARTAVGSSYWSSFFPATVVLGIGMGLTVAPLSAAALGAVESGHIGVASGVNNAISRIGGMLAIAVFGLVIAAAFSQRLEAALLDRHLPPSAIRATMARSSDLAATTAPQSMPSAMRATVHAAVDDAYTGAFQLVMLSSAAVAVVGAVIALLTVGKVRARRAASQGPVTVR